MAKYDKNQMELGISSAASLASSSDSFGSLLTSCPRPGQRDVIANPPFVIYGGLETLWVIYTASIDILKDAKKDTSSLARHAS